MQAKQDQRAAAEGQPDQQDLARAKMVDEIAGRRLRQPRHHGEHGEREAKLDIADAELRFEEREQHRQDQQMEMADPMRDRDSRQRAQRAVRLACCGAARTSTIAVPFHSRWRRKLSGRAVICP